MAEQQAGHRWFAAFWEWMVKVESPQLRRVRDEIAGGARGRVLEIGCGVGANFSYYGDGASEIIASDPDPFMLERARRRAAALGRPIDIRQASAEELPFEDGSFDAVVSTLNLCTIPHPARALNEIKRVLRSGAEFRFYDHVRYDHAFGAFWQDLVTPVWRWMGAGCHPNRNVALLIQEAGFQFQLLEPIKPVPPIPPMVLARPHIMGIARAS